MIVFQLARALNEATSADAADAARLAVLEWAWSLDHDRDPRVSARDALRALSKIEGGAALHHFRAHLLEVMKMPASGRRRGGRAARISAHSTFLQAA